MSYPTPPLHRPTPLPQSSEVTLTNTPPEITSLQKWKPLSRPVPTTYTPSRHHRCTVSTERISQDSFCRGLALGKGPADSEEAEGCQKTPRLEGSGAQLWSHPVR